MSEINFNHLSKLSVSSGRVVDFPLEAIAGDAVLSLSPASESNAPYYNALLRQVGKRPRAVGKRVTAQTVAENRNQDRELYAKHVVKGWAGVRDSSGKEVEFNEEACLQFLQAIPDWMFDDIRQFASSVTNFIDAEPVDEVSAVKN